MIKFSLILFSLILTVYGPFTNAEKKERKQSSIYSATTTDQTQNSNAAAFSSPTLDTTLQEVLFATNEDCILYISKEFNGTVLKSLHKYIKLPPGTYIYQAKSKSTFDELKGTFVVKNDASNEVFIDLLYVVDKKNGLGKAVTATRDKQQEPARKAYTAQPKAKENRILRNQEAEEATVTALLSNLVFIEGGPFTMGNNKAPTADEGEHPVTVSPVQFSRYEVTQEQWLSIMGYNSSANKDCAACPVENVSWEEAMKFIRKLNLISERKFRLPTEAEWEFVAKIGGKAELDEAGGPEEYIKKTAWYFANSGKKTHPVGEKQPNVSDIYDLYGNVSEWCLDWYHPDYYKDVDNLKDPEGPPLGKEKVVRGGSFNEYSGDRFRPSLRYKLKPTTKSPDVGFRLVMDVR